MKHPVWDRILILLCALVALGCAAGVVALLVGKISFDMITGWIAAVDMSQFVVKAAMVGIAALFVLLFLLLFAMILPSRKKRSSNYAIQRNENGMVRISLKALETLVNKCLNQHAELKVVTSSLYSDEESIRVDVHISLQSDISMPLAISALQKQIKKYLEACSGVMVQEVRVFVDSTIPADEKTEASPYAIPTALLGLDADPLPVGKPRSRTSRNPRRKNSRARKPNAARSLRPMTPKRRPTTRRKKRRRKTNGRRRSRSRVNKHDGFENVCEPDAHAGYGSLYALRGGARPDFCGALPDGRRWAGAADCAFLPDRRDYRRRKG